MFPVTLLRDARKPRVEHRIAVTQLRDYPPAKDYISRKLADGKPKREAIRCVKRHLVRVIYTTMTPYITTPTHPPTAPALT